MAPRVGVLALQGDVTEHLQALAAAGAEPSRVRDAGELSSVQGLVIPGGESSVIGMLLERYELLEPVREAIHEGMPAFGTCAGLILMAREIEDGNLPRLGVLDVLVRRNAFGRQVDKLETEVDVPALGEAPVRGVFIRAPQILSVGPSVEVLAALPRGPALVRQCRLLAAAFHPELTDDLRVHRYFLRMVGE